MINKLTGEPVSAEIQNVLKRLANSENVPEAEIQQLKEIREANSCLGNGVATIKLKDREGIQNGVYNRLQCSGSAVTDDSGHLSLTGEIRREKRLDKIGLLLFQCFNPLSTPIFGLSGTIGFFFLDTALLILF